MFEGHLHTSTPSWEKEYQDKLCAPEEAAALLESNDRVTLTGGNCIPPAFATAMSNRAKDLKNVMVSIGYCMDLYGFMDPANKESFHIETVFVGPVERMCMDQGVAQYVPVHLGDCSRYAAHANFNRVASVATPPDENGYMSRSLFGAFLDNEAIKRADTVIIEVNKNFPRMKSDDFKIHVSEVDCIIENEAPLFEIPEIEISETEEKIAAHIAEMVDNGSTIQLGFGGLGNAIGNLLVDKKDLGMHSEVISPSVMNLMKAGALNGSKKSFLPGKVAGAFCVGTQEFYDFIDENDDFIFYEIGYLNDPRVIAKNDNLVSINNALMFDLTGQAASESIGPKQYSGTGGQVNFVHGAKYSKGGKSILALNSTYTNKAGEMKSRILSLLPLGTAVSTSRNDVEYVVTEYGVANLRHRSIGDRARQLIQIAHPDFRDELKHEAKKQGWM